MSGGRQATAFMCNMIRQHELLVRALDNHANVEASGHLS